MFGRVHVFLAHDIAQRLATGRGLHHVQNFLLAPAALLDAIGVAIQHLEHRQRLTIFRQLLRHVIRRGQSHHRVKAHVIFAAERTRVCQRRGSNQSPQIRAAFEFAHQRRDQRTWRRLLHHADQRLQLAEIQCGGGITGVCRG